MPIQIFEFEEFLEHDNNTGSPEQNIFLCLVRDVFGNASTVSPEQSYSVQILEHALLATSYFSE